MLEGSLSIPRPLANTPFEAYVLEKLEKLEKLDGIEGKVHKIKQILEKVVEKQEVHDTKFEAIFYCFGIHDADIKELKKQGRELIKKFDGLFADKKVSIAYYKAVKSRIKRLEMKVAAY